MQHVKHYNVTSREQEDAAPKGKGGGRILPPDVRRKMAMKSSAGGRGMCEICHETFSLDYCRWVTIGNFKTGWACCDCKKAKQLQISK